MKLIGNLKKQVEKATDISEKRSLIENAGMVLTDGELEKVAGRGLPEPAPRPQPGDDPGSYQRSF